MHSLPLIGKFLSIIVWFLTITLLVACPNADNIYYFSFLSLIDLPYFLLNANAKQKTRMNNCSETSAKTRKIDDKNLRWL